MSDELHSISAFRPVPRTGVIFVTTEAGRRGYRANDPEWCNLGQGQPETGELLRLTRKLMSGMARRLTELDTKV